MTTSVQEIQNRIEEIISDLERAEDNDDYNEVISELESLRDDVFDGVEIDVNNVELNLSGTVKVEPRGHYEDVEVELDT
jgi:hypothetical protein